MGTVQRQTFCVAARELLAKGDTTTAKQLLDLGEKYFPEKNFEYDKYSMMMVELYYDVYGKERAAEVWDSIFKYYSQDIAYYSQYTGTSKASGVSNLLQESAQLLYGLNQLAKEVLHDQDRAQQALSLLESHGYHM